MNFMRIPRNEHPRPQFERGEWMNLNGEWDFEIDNGRSGNERGLFKPEARLSGKITVPFCPESKLSGIENNDFMYGLWYRKKVVIPNDWTDGTVKLHFGAVDYRCTAFVNGKKAGCHSGGYTSFSFDITELLSDGENVITVYAEDDTRDPLIPVGKQCRSFYSCGADYTRTTGIWQTVWLEHMPNEHIESVKYYSDAESGVVIIAAELSGAGTFCAKALYNGKVVGETFVKSNGGSISLSLKVSEIHLWELGNGQLYDLELSYGKDFVKSYFGLRTVSLANRKFYLNGNPIFQRLVLDQGFYPDGIYTAPDDSELRSDIERSMACGFNGARLHQKIFEERFLYYCDKMGYMVWGEYPDWGMDYSDPRAAGVILREWCEELERDFNHPSVVGWCPRNETENPDIAIPLLYQVTKAIDPTRLCIDASGWYHVKTDIFDVHDYNQDPVSFKANFDRLITDNLLSDENEKHDSTQHYNGEAVMVSEYGGIKWSVESGAWGYGDAPKTETEFLERFRGLTEAIMSNPYIMGFCYTQLTDVEQEQNGLYTYDRKPKFNTDLFRKILEQKAEIEK